MDCRSVLIIEDEEDIRQTVIEILKSEGYEAYGACNGREAIGLLPDIPQPPLILLDMMMPVMNGFEFLEAQKAQAQLANLPVVVVSAMPEPAALTPETGPIAAEGMLRKPIDVDNLLKVVAHYCLPSGVRMETGPSSDVAKVI